MYIRQAFGIEVLREISILFLVLILKKKKIEKITENDINFCSFN